MPPDHQSSNGVTENSVQVVKQTMRKIDILTVLKDKFLEIYRSIPHATTGMRPDEPFLHCKLKNHFVLLSLNLSPRVEKCQQKQKVSP